MRLDLWMPEYEVAARYEREIAAPLDRVWSACLDVRTGRLAAVRWLFALRRLSLRKPPDVPILDAITRSGFLILERDEPREIVLGVAGRFWTFSSGITRIASPDMWRDYAENGSARSAMSFHLESLSPRRTRITTETRVQTFGPAARRRFAMYWMLVGPFSGLIRRVWLREIARLAE